MDPLRGQYVSIDGCDQWLQRHRDCPHPTGQGRDLDGHALAGKALALTMQRQMQAELGERYVGQQIRAGAPSRNGVERRRRLGDRFARSAGDLLAHMLNHEPLSGDPFQAFSDVLTQLAQGGSAAAEASRWRGIDNALARQMIRQRPARWLDPCEALHGDGFGCRFARFGDPGGQLQLLKLQFELLDLRATLGRLSPLLTARFGELKL